MQTQRISQLIAKKILNKISSEESFELDAWVHASQHNQNLYKEIVDPENISSACQFLEGIDSERAFIKIQNRIKGPARSIRVVWWKLAAASLVPIGFAIFFGLEMLKKRDPGLDLAITPGSSRASLIIESGEKINLGDGAAKTIPLNNESHALDSNFTVIYNQSGMAPPKTPNAYNTLTTPKGGMYSLQLSDNSRVWLNADSELKYPVQFSNQKREIQLSGEAYFEIEPDSLRPFIIQLGRQRIEVLGTAFNVSAYASDQAIEATLVEGSIYFQADSAQHTMLPGQQITYYRSAETLSLLEVDASKYISWKDGLMVFEEEALSSIMLKLSRWYDFEFHFQDEELAKVQFTASLDNQTEIEDILELIAISGSVKFETAGRTVTILNK